MAENLVGMLRQLVRTKAALQEKERQLGRREQQIMATLGKLLPGIGYRLVPTGGEGRVLTRSNGAPKTQKRKRITCPKCDRRFAHPLPLARHLSATHGIKMGARKSAKKTSAKKTSVKKAR